ncbi:MAG: 5,10-methylenetetrahydromethanopterin reductase [Candidatus Heimdallarchaeota archaeon LC_2]|nr:MAG: 5,10-methylenetetrahydromethanopterin reductase [Candidatus Heimdallarchaeota archaeon LC_2]
MTSYLIHQLKYALFIPLFSEFADPQLLLEIATKAENAGWDGIFLPDHLMHDNKYGSWLDIIVSLSSIAVNTSRIKIGTWVLPLPRRQPWQLAKQLATIDQLSNGRLILGAGLGSPASDYTSIGMDYDTKILAEKLDEGLTILDLCWKGMPFSYDGKHYKLEHVELHPKPYQKPRIPILIAGRWPAKKPILRGSKWDGIMPITNRFPEQFKENELRDLVTYYLSLRENNNNGDIVIGWNQPGTTNKAEFHDLCKDIGVTWLMHNLHPMMGPIDKQLEIMSMGQKHTLRACD